MTMRLSFLRFFRQADPRQYSGLSLEQKKVLDVGCGTGRTLERFKDEGCVRVGLDLGRNALAQLQKKGNGGAVIGDACHLPFKTCGFDFVFSNEFFSHVTDFSLALHEQLRVLQHEGTLVIRDGNLLCPFTLFDLIVLYPIRSRGRYGGLKWLFTRGRVIGNIYGSGYGMKDEDVKSLLWWKKIVSREPGVTVKVATTSYVDRLPKWLARVLMLFAGQNVIVLTKC